MSKKGEVEMFKKGKLIRAFSKNLHELEQYIEELEDEIARRIKENRYHQYYSVTEVAEQDKGGPIAYIAPKDDGMFCVGSMHARDLTIISSQMVYVHLQLLKGASVQVAMGQLLTPHLDDFTARFVKDFSAEIRFLLCDKRAGKTTKSADLSTEGAASIVADWITCSSGLTGPMAFGLAVMILLLISCNFYGAFCKPQGTPVLEILAGNTASKRSGFGLATVH
jgi:hypothetical protein